MIDNKVVVEAIVKHMYGVPDAVDQQDGLLQDELSWLNDDEDLLEVKGLRAKLGQAAGWVKKNPGKALGAAAGLALGAAAIGGAARYGGRAAGAFTGSRKGGGTVGSSLRASTEGVGRAVRSDVGSIKGAASAGAGKVRSAAGKIKMPGFKKSFTEDNDMLTYLLDGAIFAYEPVIKADYLQDTNELGELIILSEDLIMKSDPQSEGYSELSDQLDFWRGFAYGAGIDAVPGFENMEVELVEKTWSKVAREKAKEAIQAKKRAGAHGQEGTASPAIDTAVAPESKPAAKPMREGKREVTAADFGEKEMHAQHGEGRFRYNKEGVATHKMDDAGNISKISGINRVMNYGIMSQHEAQANQAKRPAALAAAEGTAKIDRRLGGVDTSKLSKGALIGANIGGALGGGAGALLGMAAAHRAGMVPGNGGAASEMAKGAGMGAAAAVGGGLAGSAGIRIGAALGDRVAKVGEWAKKNPKKAALAAGAAAGALGAGAAAVRYGGAGVQRVDEIGLGHLHSGGPDKYAQYETNQLGTKPTDDFKVGAKAKLQSDVNRVKGALSKKKPEKKSDVEEVTDELLVLEDLINVASDVQDVVGKSAALDGMFIIMKSELDEMFPDEETVDEE